MRTSSAQDTLPTVQSDTVKIEMTRIVQLWQSSRDPAAEHLPAHGSRGRHLRPRGLLLDPLARRLASCVAPRLRITFQRAFPFENP